MESFENTALSDSPSGDVVHVILDSVVTDAVLVVLTLDRVVLPEK